MDKLEAILNELCKQAYIEGRSNAGTHDEVAWSGEQVADAIKAIKSAGWVKLPGNA